MTVTALRQLVALVRLGLFFVLFCLLILALDLEISTVTATDQALITPRLALVAPAAQIPLLGINVSLERSNAKTRRTTLARLKASGFGWVRQRFDWAQIEPIAGQWNWQQSDELFHDIVSANLIPVVLLDGSPAWARSTQDRGSHDNPLAPPADPTTFAHFAAAFAQRYQEQARFYQLWDEPNLAPHWGNRHIDPVSYAQLLKRSASALRQADPDAVIITAALGPTADRGHTAIDEIYFLQRLYAAGAAPYFDAVAVEPFGFGDAPDDTHIPIDHLNFQRITLVRRVMLAAHDGAKPIWAVRYGWNTRYDSPWGTVTTTDQISFAVQAQQLARQQWPWLATLGWMIDQPIRPITDPIWGFALTPALAQALAKQATMVVTSTSFLPTSLYLGHHPWLCTWLLLAALPLLGWRSLAVVHLLPWSTWATRYRAWPPLVPILLWGLLLLFYLFATWPPLILFCWLLASGLIAMQPLVGLWLAAALLPFYFQHKEIHLVETTWVVAPAQAATFCLLPALGNQLLQRTIIHFRAAAMRRPWVGLRLAIQQLRLQNGDWLALAWLASSLLTSVNVWPWPAYWNGLFELVIMPLLLYLAVRLFVLTAQQWQSVLYALLAGGVGASVIGLSDWLQGRGTEVDGVLRLVGPYFSPNQMALYLVRSLCLGMGIALYATGNWRRLWLVSCSIIALAMLLTASRGAMLLGVPAGLLIFGYAFWRSHPTALAWLKWRVPWFIWPLTLLAVAVVIALFRQRLTNLTTASQRLVTWQAAWKMWRDYPWFGVGPGGFFWHYPAYLQGLIIEPDLEHPHNIWLELATGWGVVGILWLIGWMITIVTAIRTLTVKAKPRWLPLGLLAGLVAGFAHGQVDTFGALADLAGWNWLALALWIQSNKKSFGLVKPKGF